MRFSYIFPLFFAGTAFAESTLPPLIEQTSVDQSTLDAALAALRKAHFDRQDSLLLSNVSPTLQPLISGQAFEEKSLKIVHLEFERGMHQTVVTPNFERSSVRTLTLTRNQALDLSLLEDLKRAGWMPSEMPSVLPKEISREGNGHQQLLNLKRESPREQASNVTLSIETQNATPPTPAELLAHYDSLKLPQPIPSSLKQAILKEIFGYELTRRHARKPQQPITDTSRLSVTLRLSEEAALRQGLEKEGFLPAPEGIDLYKKQHNGVTQTLAIRKTEKYLVAHLQILFSVPRKSEEL